MEDGGDAGEFGGSACTGEGASISEETTMAGELSLAGMLTKVGIEIECELFRVGLEWIGSGTSSVSRR